MTVFPSSLHLAIRRITRAPTFAATMLITLSLGIGVTTAVFALVYAVLLRPLPFSDPDRLVALGHTARPDVELAHDGLSPGTLLHYRDESRVFDGMAAYMEKVYSLSDGDGVPEQVRVAQVTPDFFPVLRARPHLGRYFAPDESEPGTRPGVIISHEIWTRRYGSDPNIVGRTIEVNRRTDQVIGVMEPEFRFPHRDTDVWMATWLQRRGAGIQALQMSGIARLREGVTPEQAERELNGLVRTLPEAYPGVTLAQLEEMGLRARVSPLREAIVGDVRLPLLLLLLAAGFLLLVTWANATTLSLVRAEGQRRDIEVERALGAPPRSVARRFFVESLLLAGCGGALGVGVAWLAVRHRFGFSADQIPRLREAAVDGPVLLFAVALILTSWLLLGAVAYFAARGGRTTVLGGMRGRSTAGLREQVTRRLLVAGQVALALVLLSGATLMAQSYWKLSRVQLGFRPEGALTFSLPLPPTAYGDYHASTRTHQALLERLRALPGVQSAEVASGSAFPLNPVPSYYNEPIAVDGRALSANGEWPYALFGFASPGYFQAMGIPLLRGRTFGPEDMGPVSPGVVLSGALAAALFPGEDPVGRRVRWALDPAFPAYTVVGVAGDVPAETMRGGGSRILYFANAHPPVADEVTGVLLDYIPSDEVYVLRTSLAPAALLPAVRRAITAVDPKLLAVRPITLDQMVAESMAQVRLTMVLLLTGASTALILGLVGIYGVLAYMVRQRASEFAIRMALGATPGNVTWSVVRQGMGLAVLGVAVGLLAAGILTRALGSLLYGVAPGEPAALAVSALLLLAAALAASFLPARRAGRTEPGQALRAE